MDATPASAAPGPGRAHITITPLDDDDWHRHQAAFAYASPDGWTATGTVVRTRRRGVVVTSINISGPPDEDGEVGAVTSSALREIPTGEIAAAAMASGHLPEYEYAQPAAPVEPKRQPGRQPLAPSHLQDVALRYIAETLPGKPRGAVQRLADHYGKPVQTVSRWVMRARQDGWLGPAVAGREGGEPGPRLLALGLDEVAALLVEYINSGGGNVTVLAPARAGDPFQVWEITDFEPVAPRADPPSAE